MAAYSSSTEALRASTDMLGSVTGLALDVAPDTIVQWHTIW